ncbi:MAG TPA: rubrerythrin family protein [Desulfovibrio sp.]|jgi:rubrerythrin|uniref:rubrerythrin family protein n=1 Tax=Desulfovibrio TaxID=872 RepID=UPI002BFE772B|nr:rubrerythrin family protein [Desulfovibrio sp.]HMM37919.1 rubrerythrin family protein [Desulfovibrio sp.]
MSKTDSNLKQAFAGESQANRKYLAFAQQADKEGYSQVAMLFRAAAEAETVHAHSHLRALGAVGSTVDNLKEAVGGETYEFETMYPPMIEAAVAEGNKAAERSFRYALDAEQVHAELYAKALKNLEAKEEVSYLICTVCGYIAENEAPAKCPICGAAAKAFRSVN